MSNSNTFPLNEIAAHFKAALQKAPRVLGNDAVNFFLDSFKKQGWQGASFERWQKRNPISKWGKIDDPGRAILIGKGTAHLKRDIKITSVSGMQATIGTSLPYARAHNEGFKGIVHQNVHSFTRRNGQQVKGFSRTINQNIPKRQFMGDSPVLTEQLTRHLETMLMTGLPVS